MRQWDMALRSPCSTESSLLRKVINNAEGGEGTRETCKYRKIRSVLKRALGSIIDFKKVPQIEAVINCTLTIGIKIVSHLISIIKTKSHVTPDKLSARSSLFSRYTVSHHPVFPRLISNGPIFYPLGSMFLINCYIKLFNYKSLTIKKLMFSWHTSDEIKNLRKKTFLY